MTMASIEGDRIEHGPWRERALLLAALGALGGLLFDELVKPGDRAVDLALASFIAVGGVVLAFSLERLRAHWSLAFALLGATVSALVAWWNGSPGGWGADEGWQFASAVAAVAIAVPLFQAARDEGALRFPVAAVHAHAWSNAILWGAAMVFTVASVILTLLLSELFALIGLTFLRNLVRESAFMWSLACAAFGGAVGLLRDRDTVADTLQRVARAILAVLAPVLAVGLAFFVLALPFTGLEPLWDQTQATTPILLACMVGAAILINAAAGNSADDEVRAPPVRWAAMTLAACLLPLALVAAVSTAKRIGQYGFTPDRLWAAVFVAVAAAVALGYLGALIRGRRAWAEPLRRANVALAGGVCLLALFLALPIVSFGSLSARDQVTRLERGRIAPERFDWAALRWDFGPEGRAALERLARTGPAALRARAASALKAQNRYAHGAPVPPPPPAAVLVEGGAAMPPALAEAIGRARQCGVRQEGCRLALLSAGEAVLVSAPCATCRPGSMFFVRRPDGSWVRRGEPEEGQQPEQEAMGVPQGPVEVREVTKRQVFVGNRPVGAPID
jgi:hypothetical protein